MEIREAIERLSEIQEPVYASLDLAMCPDGLRECPARLRHVFMAVHAFLSGELDECDNDNELADAIGRGMYLVKNGSKRPADVRHAMQLVGQVWCDIQ